MIDANYLNYSPDHGLMVVDMQAGFLSDIRMEEEVKYHVPRLIHNIVDQITACLKKRGPVVIVEYEGHGPTHPAITEAASGHHTHFLMKQWEGLMHGKNKDAGRIGGYFAHQGNLGISYSITGVNASGCVKTTATGLEDTGIFVKILCGATLDLFSANHNLLCRLNEQYGWRKDLLHLPTGYDSSDSQASLFDLL